MDEFMKKPSRFMTPITSPMTAIPTATTGWGGRTPVTSATITAACAIAIPVIPSL